MGMDLVQRRGIAGETDEQGVGMAGLTVKFANFAGNGVARRGTMLLVRRATAELPAVSGEDPICRENWLEGAAGSPVAIDSEKTARLIGRGSSLCFDLNEVKAIEVKNEVRRDRLARNR